MNLSAQSRKQYFTKKHTQENATMELPQVFRSARRSGVPLMAIRTADPAATIATLKNGAFNGSVPPFLQWDIVSGITSLNKPVQESNTTAKSVSEQTRGPVHGHHA